MLVCPGHPYAPELARLARTRLEPGARLARDTLARQVVGTLNKAKVPARKRVA